MGKIILPSTSGLPWALLLGAQERLQRSRLGGRREGPLLVHTEGESHCEERRTVGAQCVRCAGDPCAAPSAAGWGAGRGRTPAESGFERPGGLKLGLLCVCAQRHHPSTAQELGCHWVFKQMACLLN